MGLANDLLELIQSTCAKGEIFTAASFQMDGVSYRQISHTLSGLRAKGLIEKGPMKGQYFWKPSNGHSPDPERVVIDNLLDAMAKAEPILKKWQRVHDALQDL